MHVATRRLITASEGLDPASRALLNIWIHQGLDDAAIARLSGMSPASLDERRQKIVAQLASALGAPPEDVREAIARLAGPDDEPPAEPAAPANGELSTWGSSVVAEGPVAEGPLAGRSGAGAAEADSEPRAEPEVQTWKPASRNPRLRVAIAILGLIAVVAVTVAAASSSGGPNPAPAASSPAASSPPASTTRAPAASWALTPVPGGPAGAAGTISLSGTPLHAVLRISVTGLPATATGHYEIWLYNSIIDSVPLGRLSATGAPLTVTLPANYGRYRYFDVSLQPAGINPNHSGQSVLRVSAGPGG